MYRNQMRQICRKCKGNGTNGKPEINRDGQQVIAPPFQKGQGDQLQMANCSECVGSGWAMYESPNLIMVEGQKVQLTEEEKRGRFQDALA